jgi:hypothetical protein
MIPTEEMGQEALRLLAAVNSDPLVTEAVRKVVDGLEQDIGLDIISGTIRATAEYLKGEHPELWVSTEEIVRVLAFICEKAVREREERSHTN